MFLITGASRGIGKYLLKSFVEQGKIVKGTYYNTPPEDNLKEYFTKVNIIDEESVRNWIEKEKQSLNEIVLINCAGINYNSFGHKAKLASWREVIEVNLIGVFNVIKTVLPIMREQNYGRIINFSSVVAQIGIAGTSAYSASKAGLWGLTKSLAIENATKGITINTLNLGYFDIGMITDVPQNMLDIIKQKIPKGELGNPLAILQSVQYLISCDYINGTSLNINGGLF
jgi:NAD(P)-dependent dehydrogenase (short-subunit alcohol dehydrogenase family)